MVTKPSTCTRQEISWEFLFLFEIVTKTIAEMFFIVVSVQKFFRITPLTYTIFHTYYIDVAQYPLIFFLPFVRSEPSFTLQLNLKALGKIDKNDVDMRYWLNKRHVRCTKKVQLSCQ